MRGGGEPDIRPRQVVMRAQRLPRIGFADQALAAQQGHNVADEDVEHGRQHGRHQVEAVCCAAMEPVHHQVGDLLGRAGRDEVPPRAGQIAEELPQRRLFSPDKADDDFRPAARCLQGRGIREVLGGQGRVERQVREVMSAKPARQALAADFRVAQVVEFTREALRLGLRRADDRAEAWQDQDWSGGRPSSTASRLRSA